MPLDPNSKVFEDDFNLFQNDAGNAARRADASLFVKFYPHWVKNDVKSLEEGRLVADSVDFIEIRVPGDRNNIVVRPVTDADKQRFAPQWANYQNASASIGDGTPLDQWPIINSALVEELKYLGFYTVEHVANASDAAAQKMPGLYTLKQRAQAFIAAAKETAPLERLIADNEEKDRQIKALQAQIDELAKRLPVAKVAPSAGE